jgi:superfamily II helicase
MVTEKSFQTAMAMLALCGLKVEEEIQLVMWKNLVNDLDDKLFQKAVLDMCKNTQKFWETDNVPAMIRERVEAMKEDVRRLDRVEASRKQIDQWAKDAVPMPKNFLKVLKAYNIPETGGENEIDPRRTKGRE